MLVNYWLDVVGYGVLSTPEMIAAKMVGGTPSTGANAEPAVAQRVFRMIQDD